MNKHTAQYIATSLKQVNRKIHNVYSASKQLAKMGCEITGVNQATDTLQEVANELHAILDKAGFTTDRYGCAITMEEARADY